MEKRVLLVGEPMGLFIANEVGQLENVGSFTPVSYTHLDVYKRQTVNGVKVVFNGSFDILFVGFLRECGQFVNSSSANGVLRFSTAI